MSVFDLIFSNIPEISLGILIGIRLFMPLKETKKLYVLGSIITIVIASNVIMGIEPMIRILLTVSLYVVLYRICIGSWRKALTATGLIYYIFMICESIPLFTHLFNLSGCEFYYLTAITAPTRIFQIVTLLILCKKDFSLSETLIFAIPWHEMRYRHKFTTVIVMTFFYSCIFSGYALMTLKLLSIQGRHSLGDIDFAFTISILSTILSMLSVVALIKRTGKYELYDNMFARPKAETVIGIMDICTKAEVLKIQRTVDEYVYLSYGYRKEVN